MTKTLSALALAPEETHVWYAHDREITHPERLRACAAVLSQDERIRQTRFYFAHDRHQFLVPRALVRDVLSRYYPQVTPGTWTMGKTAWGKPFVKNLPDGERLYFNVSHTHGLVALPATRAGEVGIDVEQPRRRCSVWRLQKRCAASASTQHFWRCLAAK